MDGNNQEQLRKSNGSDAMALRIEGRFDQGQMDTQTASWSFEYVPDTDHITLSVTTGEQLASDFKTPLQTSLGSREVHELIQWLRQVTAQIDGE